MFLAFGLKCGSPGSPPIAFFSLSAASPASFYKLDRAMVPTPVADLPKNSLLVRSRLFCWSGFIVIEIFIAWSQPRLDS